MAYRPIVDPQSGLVIREEPDEATRASFANVEQGLRMTPHPLATGGLPISGASLDDPLRLGGARPPASSASSAAPLDDMTRAAVARQLRLSQNPLYRFTTAAMGGNPDAAVDTALKFQQQQQLGAFHQAQTMNFLINAVDTFSKMALTPEQAESLVPMLTQGFTFAANGKPDVNPEPFVRAALSGQASITDLVNDMRDMTPAQRRVIEGLYQQRKYTEARQSIEEFRKVADDDALRSATAKLRRLPRDRAYTLTEAADALGLSDREFNAVSRQGQEFLTRHNVLPTTGAVTEATATAEARGKEAAKPDSTFEIRDGQVFRIFKDPAKTPEVVKDTRSMSPGEKARLTADLLAEARRRVLEPFRGPLGSIELGDVPKDQLDAQIDRTHKHLLGEVRLGEKVAAPAPLTTGKEDTAVKALQKDIGAGKITKASEAIAALVKAGVPEARARELVRQLVK